MRIREILTEYSRQRTRNTFGKRLLDAARKDDMLFAEIENLPDEKQKIDRILDVLEAMDPTPSKKYTDWIVREYVRPLKEPGSQGFTARDAARVSEILRAFDRAQGQLRARGRPTDVMRYSFPELEYLADQLAGKTEQIDDTYIRIPVPTELADDIEVLHAGPDGTLYRVKSWEAAKYLGKGSKWCISASDEKEGRTYFDTYSKSGQIYVWVDNRGKWAFLPYRKEYKDRRDREISDTELRKFRRNRAIYRHVFQPYERDLLKSGDIYGIISHALRFIGGRWPEAEPILARSPQGAYQYAAAIIRGRWPEGEAAILGDPAYAVRYVRDVLRKRWPEAEPVIARDMENAIEYARDVLGHRWPKAEKIIATDPFAAYRYAAEVVGGRWPEGEDAIARNPWVAYLYARDILGSPWPKGEAAIATDPEAAHYYAKDVIRGPWPKGEPAIAKNERWAKRYESEILGGDPKKWSIERTR